jgi:hypothetical protein
MMQLAFSYAGRAGLDFEPMATSEFLERLAFACAQRWGLVNELLIEALTHAIIANDTVCTIEHFTQAYQSIYGVTAGYSPLPAPNYKDCFDPDALLKLLGEAEGTARKKVR